MKKRCLAVALAALLGLVGLAQAGTTKENLVKFYQDYLTLVSASDYVSVSRDHPDTWDAKFNAIAKDAGFEDSADALTASESMSGDSDIAAMRKAVTDKILLQYKPYRE